MHVIADDKPGRCVSIELQRFRGLPVTIVDLDGPSGPEWREQAEGYAEPGEELRAVMIVDDAVQFWFREAAT